MIGETVSHYRIVEQVGAGGMGVVFKAEDLRLKRSVALKFLSAELTRDADAKARLEREARAVAALNHSRICQLYDVGPDYLVMEFIEGVPLRGPLPLEKTVDYAQQILDALDAAHVKGITHRDLKPANILVTRQGIKLLDFGLAKQAAGILDGESMPTGTLTGQGRIVGTWHYMSPEQLQGKVVDSRSDLFSFGCVLYEMLAGRRAFEGTSPASVIAAILEHEPPSLDIGHPLYRVVQRSLAKDPDERFQTARDLKAALAWALEQPRASSAAPPRGRWWIAAAATALLLGAIGGWVAASWRSPSVDERVLRFEIAPPAGGRFFVGINGGGVALSPDGGTAAYVVAVKGKRQLWVQPLDSAARPLDGTDDAGHPFWSPDGRSIAFFAGTNLRRIDVVGGSPLTICDCLVAGRQGTWTGDGRILFATAGGTIFQVSASGGTPSRLTTLDASRAELTHFGPRVLPGNRFMYAVRSQMPEHMGVYAAPLDDPTRRVKLVSSNTNALYAPGADGNEYLLWLRGTTLLGQAFDPAKLQLLGEPRPIADPVGSIANQGLLNAAVSNTGLLLYDVSNTLRQLAWFDRTGKPLGAASEPGADFWFRLSPDGRRVVTARDSADGADLWLLDIGRGVASRLTASTGVDLWPIWSPDGRAVVFSSSSRNLVRKLASGAGRDEPLTKSPRVQNPMDWSRDGRFLLYYETAPDTQRDLWVLPMTAPDGGPDSAAGGTPKPRPYLASRFNEWQARFSPEPSPRWVAYASDESGRFEVYVRTFPEPGGAWRISTAGGNFPAWSPDARELFYLAPDGRLMAVSLKLEAEAIEAGPPRPLFSPTIVDTTSHPYDVSPDGQRFLISGPPEGPPQPLAVIVNWPALLKRVP